MSNEGAKRLTLSLTLNPALSGADRFAIRALKQWYQQAKHSHKDEQDLQATVRKFHRDVYLSGLFLHLLHPGLASNLANLTTDGQISLSTLCHQLNSLGFPLHEGDAAPQELPLEDLKAALSAQTEPAMTSLLSQVQQLTALVQSQQQQLQNLSGLNVTANTAKPQRMPSPEDDLQNENLRAQVKKIKQKGLF